MIRGTSIKQEYLNTKFSEGAFTCSYQLTIKLPSPPFLYFFLQYNYPLWGGGTVCPEGLDFALTTYH